MTYLLSQAKSKNEMSKSAVNELMHASLSKILFNTVLKSGIMPQTWCNGIITPILKSGAESDPSNYRAWNMYFQLPRKTFLFNSQPMTS